MTEQLELAQELDDKALALRHVNNRLTYKARYAHQRGETGVSVQLSLMAEQAMDLAIACEDAASGLRGLEAHSDHGRRRFRTGADKRKGKR